MENIRARARVFKLLDATDGGIGIDKMIDVFLIGLTLLNVLSIVLGTVPRYDKQYHNTFATIEMLCVYVFTIEYVLRMWTIVEKEKYADPVTGRLRYAVTPMAIVDLLAVLPFFLANLFGMNPEYVRVLRLFRMLKISRYITALTLIEQVVYSKRKELAVTVMVIGMMLVFVSSLMYAVENDAQPDKFGSIPETMWWGVATLTTVGYGDVFPVTVLGKAFSSIIAVLGLGLFALPTGILASGFNEALNKKNECEPEKCYCPHCGNKLS